MGIFDVDPEFVNRQRQLSGEVAARAELEQVADSTGMGSFQVSGGTGNPYAGSHSSWQISIPSALDKPINAPDSNDPLSQLAVELPSRAFGRQGRVVSIAGGLYLIDEEENKGVAKRAFQNGPIGLSPHALRSKKSAKEFLERRKRVLNAAHAVTYFHLAGGVDTGYDDTSWSVDVTSDGHVRRWSRYSNGAALHIDAIKKWRYDNGY